MTNSASSSSYWTLPILATLLMAALAILIKMVLFSGVDAPPVDYGTGSMFDLIATRYDGINRALALGMDLQWRQRMVDKIRESIDHYPPEKDDDEQVEDNADSQQSSPPSARILDVATGTADVALLLAQSIPQATITGIDPSRNMITVGRQKVSQRQLDETITLHVTDARYLANDPLLGPSATGSYHAATMAFGIRNIPEADGERNQALCEIHRVLRPYGRFCILEFSEPDESFGTLGALARLFIRHVVPVLGGVLSGAPKEYMHLQNSIQHFPTPREFAKQLQSLTCGSAGTGYFRVEELEQMNFGSVQLYVAKAMQRGQEGEEPEDDANEEDDEAEDEEDAAGDDDWGSYSDDDGDDDDTPVVFDPFEIDPKELAEESRKELSDDEYQKFVQAEQVAQKLIDSFMEEEEEEEDGEDMDDDQAEGEGEGEGDGDDDAAEEAEVTETTEPEAVTDSVPESQESSDVDSEQELTEQSASESMDSQTQAEAIQHESSEQLNVHEETAGMEEHDQLTENHVDSDTHASSQEATWDTEEAIIHTDSQYETMHAEHVAESESTVPVETQSQTDSRQQETPATPPDQEEAAAEIGHNADAEDIPADHADGSSSDESTGHVNSEVQAESQHQ